MNKDASHFMKKCDECQRHPGMNHMPAENLHMISSPCPFRKKGLDIVGPLPRVLMKENLFWW